jgi:hypothetical protein
VKNDIYELFFSARLAYFFMRPAVKTSPLASQSPSSIGIELPNAPLRCRRSNAWNTTQLSLNTQLMLTHNRLNKLGVQLQTQLTLTVPTKKFTLSQPEKQAKNWFHSLI